MPEILKDFMSFRFLYVMVAGFFFYLVSITFDTIFIPRLEMSQGWCEEWEERKVRYRSQNECVKFMDRFQELVYRHNQKIIVIALFHLTPIFRQKACRQVQNRNR